MKKLFFILTASLFALAACEPANGPQGGDEPQDEEQQGDEDGGQMPEPKELNADQERMLNAIQAEEDKTQEKLKEGEKVLVVPGKKNW